MVRYRVCFRRTLSPLNTHSRISPSISLQLLFLTRKKKHNLGTKTNSKGEDFMIGQRWKERTCFGGGGFEWPQPFHEWRAVIWDEPTYNLCVKKKGEIRKQQVKMGTWIEDEVYLLAGELAEGAEDTNSEQRRMRIPTTRTSLPIDSIQEEEEELYFIYRVFWGQCERRGIDCCSGFTIKERRNRETSLDLQSLFVFRRVKTDSEKRKGKGWEKKSGHVMRSTLLLFFFYFFFSN